GFYTLDVLGVPDANAALIAFSSQYSATDYGPARALDLDPTGQPWLSANGQISNQWVKLALPQGALWVVDQLALQPRADCCDDQSQSPGGAALAYRWSFGDGTGSTERDPVHRFPATGVYQVALTVQDTAGLSSTYSLLYHAFGPPAPNFSFTPALPGEAQSVT